MASTAILNVKILADASKATASMDQASSKVGKMQGGMSKLLGPATAAGAALVVFGKQSFDAASKLEQSMGAVDAVFGKNSAKVHEWARGAADDVGLAKSEYAELAAGMGAQLNNMGVDQGKLAKKTDGLISMGADLAAQFGGTTADAVAALGSLMRGEADPIEAYGVSIKQADIAAQMAADGTSKLEGEQKKAAQTQAMMTLLTNQTASAHGAFAREADTAAVQQQKMNAEMENAKAKMGQALLPIVGQLASKLGDLAKWAKQNTEQFQLIAVAIGVMVVAVYAINVALKVYQATLVVVKAVQKATWLTNPIGLVVIAIIAVVAAVVILWKRSETFRKIVLGVWAAIKTAAVTSWNAIKNAVLKVWDSLKSAAQKAKSVITGIWNAIKTIATAVWSAIKSAVTRDINNITAIVNGFKTAAIAVFNLVKSTATGVWNTIQNTASTVWNAIQSAVTGAINKVVAKFRALPGQIKGALSGAAQMLVSIGRAIVEGLGAGIEAAKAWLMGKVNSIADAIPGWLKKRLGIGSPSKVTTEIGKDIMAGIGVGMIDGLSGVETIITDAVDRMVKLFGRKAKTDKIANQVAKTAAKAYKDEAAAMKANAKARDDLYEELATEQDILKGLIEARTSYATAVRESAVAFGAATNLADEEATTADQMLADMAARVAKVQRYAGLLAQLAAGGLAPGLVDQLAQAGVEGGLALAENLAAGGPATIAAFNDQQRLLEAAATSMGETTASVMHDQGIAAQQALVNGLLADQAKLEAAAVQLAKAFALAFEAALADALDKIEVLNKRIKKKKGKDADSQSLAAPSLAGVTTHVSRTGAGAHTTPTGGVVNVTVNGAIDPESTARQIRRILQGHDRRVGVFAS